MFDLLARPQMQTRSRQLNGSVWSLHATPRTKSHPRCAHGTNAWRGQGGQGHAVSCVLLQRVSLALQCAQDHVHLWLACVMQVHDHGAARELGPSASVHEQQPQGVLGAVFSPVFNVLQQQAGAGDDSKDSTGTEASSDAATESDETALAVSAHSHQHMHVPEAVEHELPPDAGAQEVDEEEYFDFDPLLFIGSLPALEKVGTCGTRRDGGTCGFVRVQITFWGGYSPQVTFKSNCR